ncbi:MAG TPA: protein kinase, partial [Polyangium sp.]|nr:protein kinase [Polyangium sp.]
MVATALDVVILTVIPCELQAVLNTLALSNRWTEEMGTVYYRGTVHSALSGRALQVAATCIGHAGNSAETAAVCNAIAQWQPQAVLLVGIAAGLRDRLRLGRVVLSDRVIAYEHAAVLDRSGSSHQQPRPEGSRLPHMMVQQLASYEPKSARLTERFLRAGRRFPSVGSDESDKVATSIQVTRATIASGEKLLRDAQKLEEIRDLHGKIEAFDMESAGMVEACDRDHVPWLVIRGISDFGDAQKDDRFQDFAARSAAAVLADFLAHGWDLPPANPHRTSQRLSPTPQIPKYGDEHTRILSEQLQDARRRRITLANAGAKTDKLDKEILELKRKLREGGQLRPGDSLGERYLLLEPIGRGGFATVWKALDETTNSHVAIKILHTEIAGDVVRRDRFYRGARTMSTLEHPAVVRVLEPYGEDGGYCYFVMEYVAGGDLRRAVLDGRLDKPISLALLLPIGEALAEAHARGIVHRDVKPANILLDKNNHP